MPNEIRNADSFEHFLDGLAGGISNDARVAANKAGADEFVRIMKPKIPKRSHVSSGEVHLRDSLIEVQHSNGAVDVGFTGEGGKGYIGRIINDGWDVTDRNGEKHSHVAGKHFWEEAQREARGKVSQAVAKSLKSGTGSKKVSE